MQNYESLMSFKFIYLSINIQAISDINKTAKVKFRIKSKRSLLNFMSTISCEQQNQQQTLATIFKNFIQKIHQNIEVPPSLILLGKQNINNIENKFYIKIRKIKKLNQVDIFLNIDKISEEEQIKQLKEQDEYKTNLLAKVAHDIRNPINSVNYLIRETKEATVDLPNSEQQSKITKNLVLMKSSICFLLFLVNDILDFCQFKNKRIKFGVNSILVSNYLKKLKKIIKVQTKMKNIKFIIENEVRSDLEIKTDKNRLTQVIINLVSNAIKFTNQFGYIVLKMYKQTGDLLKVSIKDTGSGMSEEVINRITEPFQSFGNSNNPNEQGIGLGLHISKEIIKVLGPNTSFKIKSEINQGSKFSFLIYTNFDCHQPIACNQDPENQSETNIKYSETSANDVQAFIVTAQIQDNPKVILIVDDDAFNQTLLKNIILKKYPRMQILIASNGEEAIKLFKQGNSIESNHAINLIIMDCKMPILYGYKASKIIKELIRTQGYQPIKIIGNSGLFYDKDIDQAYECGMDDILQKPSSAKQILIKIAKYI